MVPPSCALVPLCLVEDHVDFIGISRDRQEVGANALLFELLNQMDGLAEDADILYVLTTNRPDIMEPALAAHSGRIDQAIEVPLPDDSCRRRLLDLYSKELDLRVEDMDRLVARTKGVSGAFIRELLRKAALLAADESDRGRACGQRRPLGPGSSGAGGTWRQADSDTTGAGQGIAFLEAADAIGRC